MSDAIPTTDRARVPGGWLVRAYTQDPYGDLSAPSITFVPDPDYRWGAPVSGWAVSAILKTNPLVMPGGESHCVWCTGYLVRRDATMDQIVHDESCPWSVASREQALLGEAVPLAEGLAKATPDYTGGSMGTMGYLADRLRSYADDGFAGPDTVDVLRAAADRLWALARWEEAREVRRLESEAAAVSGLLQQATTTLSKQSLRGRQADLARRLAEASAKIEGLLVEHDPPKIPLAEGLAQLREMLGDSADDIDPAVYLAEIRGLDVADLARRLAEHLASRPTPSTREWLEAERALLAEAREAGLLDGEE